MGRERQALGRYGEGLTARAYERAGYEVLARNWRCRAGELDLVLGRGRELVVCEVKTRSSLLFGSPAEAVDSRKQQRLRVLAARYVNETGRRPASIRFDVASVLGGRLELIEGAF